MTMTTIPAPPGLGIHPATHTLVRERILWSLTICAENDAERGEGEGWRGISHMRDVAGLGHTVPLPTVLQVIYELVDAGLVEVREGTAQPTVWRAVPA